MSEHNTSEMTSPSKLSAAPVVNEDFDDKNSELELETEVDGHHLPPGMFEQDIINRFVIILFLANWWFNIDMGILPAASKMIMADLKLDVS